MHNGRPGDQNATPMHNGRGCGYGRAVSETGPAAVTLVAVDDDVLERLVLAATTDAAPDDVTPPLTPRDGWSPARLRWLRAYHRDRRAGVDGPHGEATRAIVVAGVVAGAVRWQRTTEPGAFEVGIWLRRSARGRGVAKAAVAAAAREAAGAGAQVVVARTTAANTSALGVLRGLGFATAPADPDGGVRATWQVNAGPGHPAAPGPSVPPGP